MISKKDFEEDLIPVTMYVLSIIGYAYVSSTLKFLIEYKYPHLRGKLSTDHVDSECLKLLCEANDELENLAIETANLFHVAAHSLAKVYGLDMDQIARNVKLGDLASCLYFETIYDDFPRDNELDDAGKQFPTGDLWLFACSTVTAVCVIGLMLCDDVADHILVINGEDNLFAGFLTKDCHFHGNAAAIRILQDLGNILTTTQAGVKELIATMIK